MPTIEMLVTVKAYPALSTKYGEVVCVAGIRVEEGQFRWTRLFPVPFRDLPFAQRFKKYQWVNLDAEPHGGDPRPESLRPNPDSVQCGAVLDTRNGWRKRREYVEPLMVPSMCWLQSRQREDGTSLGVFRPRQVLEFQWENVSDWSEEQLAITQQPSLFFPGKAGLEKIPYRFRYRWRCDDDRCHGHSQSIIDWELAESYRSWRDRYDDATLMDKLREKWLDQMCAPDRDTAFFAGNMHRHPESFLILGVFWPPKESI